MKPDSFWQRFFGTYRFCQNFGRESWWASFRGAVRAAWGGISRAIAVLVIAITSCSWTKSLVVLQCSCVVQGGGMPTLAQIYENQAEECLRTAAKTEDPQRRALMLKLAHAWRKDAEALKRGQKLQPASSPRKAKALGAVRKVRRNCTYPAAA